MTQEEQSQQKEANSASLPLIPQQDTSKPLLLPVLPEGIIFPAIHAINVPVFNPPGEQGNGQAFILAPIPQQPIPAPLTNIQQPKPTNKNGQPESEKKEEAGENVSGSLTIFLLNLQAFQMHVGGSKKYSSTNFDFFEKNY